MNSYRKTREIVRLVAEVLEQPLECCMVADPERDELSHVIADLKTLANGARLVSMPTQFAHPVQQSLHKLLVEGDSFMTEISLGDVKGVSATNGGTDSGKFGFRLNLDCLPETMFLRVDETYGPLSDSELSRLKQAVASEFPLRNGLLDVTLQSWDGTYIAHNDGASRRFALLRRLRPNEKFPARVHPLKLSLDALRVLREQWRVVVLAKCVALPTMMDTLCNLSEGLFWERGDNHRHLVAIPGPHRVSKNLAGPLAELHNRLDVLGTFDVGRYITEQISVGRQQGKGGSFSR